MHRCSKLVGCLLFLAASAAIAGVVLQPPLAPEWHASPWVNTDPGSVAQNRGRVVLIGFIRSTCPESRAFLIPVLQRWNERYGQRDDVVITLMHRSLRGERTEPLREFIRENGVSVAVGIDSYDDPGEYDPTTTRRYGVRNTPHLAIVDKAGLLRFTHEGVFDIEPVEAFIDRLLEEAPGTVYPTYDEGSSVERPALAFAQNLSGAYVFRTDQATGTCGAWIPSMETPAKLRVYRDAIDIEFARPFLGLDAMEVQFEAETGRVAGQAALPRSGRAGRTPGRVLRLEGVFEAEHQPPELTFELSFSDGRCAVKGRARRH